ncbi:MAG: hypothetical protein ACXWLG_09990, partial [Myxococcaceae bacterium]
MPSPSLVLPWLVLMAAGSGAATPQATPVDGRAALVAMRAAYDGRWYTTLTFVQKTRRWDAQRKETQETWYESLR